MLRRAALPLSLLLLAACASSQAGPAGPPPTPRPTVAPYDDGRETRALWAWDNRSLKSRSDVDAMVAKLDQAHLNVILLMIYHDGTVYFDPSPRRFPDERERLVNQSRFKDETYRDALSYLLAIRDMRRADHDPHNDFEVHAWFSVHRGGKTDTTQERPRPDTTQPYMLNAIFPEFKLKYAEYYSDRDTRYVDHSVSVLQEPKFRAYMADLIAGLVEDYPVDGVHLDYIRTGGICYNNDYLDYPGTEFDFSGCQVDYRNWTRQTYGHAYTLWEDTDRYGRVRDGGSGRVAAWLEHSVSQVVKLIHDEVKAVRANVVISAAVGLTSPNTRKESNQGQAAWEWLDRGWIDAAFVMAYIPDTRDVVDKMQEFRDAVQLGPKRLVVFPGLATYTIGDDSDLWSDLIVQQVNEVTARRPGDVPLTPPARGVALFVDRFLSDAAIRALVQGPFEEYAIPFWGE